MNWDWANSLDDIWRSPTFPMWLTLAAAGFFAVILLLTLLRAERSVANGALTVITLLAIAIAAAATLRGFDSGAAVASSGTPPPQIVTALPALSCIDDLAGETVETACEKALFGSAESSAAAVSYAAARLSRLVALGDVATANKSLTPSVMGLRRSIERDRYGLVAYVLSVQDRCQPTDCAAYQSLTDHNQIAANMNERVYEGLIIKYALTWNAAPAGPTAAMAALPQSMPTGKPTNADFPTSASIPPVNIMTPEPGPGSPSPRPPTAANAQSSAPKPAPGAKKPPAPKQTRAVAPAPVQLSPPPGAPSAARAPAAAED